MHDWTGSTAQLEALKVPCAYCQSVAGEVCVRYDKQPLAAFPSHTVRALDARAAASKDAS